MQQLILIKNYHIYYRRMFLLLLMGIAWITAASAVTEGWDAVFDPINNDVEHYPGYPGSNRSMVDFRQGAVALAIDQGSDENCTGTLIAENLIITAGHCAEVVVDPPNNEIIPPVTEGYYFDFNFQKPEDINGPPPEHRQVSYRIGHVYKDQWGADHPHDYVIARLDDNPSEIFPITPIAAIDLVIDEPLTIIQHPHRKGGNADPRIAHPKKVKMGFNMGKYQNHETDYAFKYKIESRSGTSGSGVLDESGFLVALHSAVVNGNNEVKLGASIRAAFADSSRIRELASVWTISDETPRQLAVDGHGYLYAIGPDYNLYRYQPDEHPVKRDRITDFNVSQVLAGGLNVFVVDYFDNVYIYDNGNWNKIGTLGNKVVADNSGKIYRLSENRDSVALWTGTNQNWVSIGYAIGITNIFAGRSTVYYTRAFTGEARKYTGSFNHWELVSDSQNVKSFVIHANEQLVRLLNNGVVQLKQNGQWKVIAKGVDRVWSGNTNIYISREKTGEVFEWIRPGLWDKLTRPVDEFVAGHGIIAAVDHKTQQLHRYRISRDQRLHFEPHLVDGVEMNSHHPGNTNIQRHYVIDVPEGTDQLDALLEWQDSNANLQLWGRAGAKPTPGNYEFLVHDGIALIDDPQAGLWHFIVTAAGFSSTNFSLKVDLKQDTPMSPCMRCRPYSGYLSYTNDYDIQPNENYFYSNSGLNEAWLEGPSNSDFDLRLYYWNGNYWVDVDISESPSSSEYIYHYGYPGYYFWEIFSYQGSGTYNFWINE